MTNLTTRALLCAVGALLTAACGEPGATVFAPEKEQNVGASGSSTGGMGGMGGMAPGSGGMVMGSGGAMPDAGVPDSGFADSGDAGELADAGEDAAIDAGETVVTAADICTAHCQAKQAFADANTGDTCITVDAAGCQAGCLAQVGPQPPTSCDALWGAFISCLTDNNSFECFSASVDAVSAPCTAEVIAASTCTP